MRVVILGASGRIGSLVVQQAVDAGHEPVAFVRPSSRVEAPAGVVVVRGEIHRPDDLRSALVGAGAVIAALGPRRNAPEEAAALESGMRHLVAAMETSGVARLVALSGAGIDVAGDRKPAVDRVASRIVRTMARHVVGAKQREFAVFAATDLDWTALRPAIVTSGDARGYRLDLALIPGARVTRADVAQALVDQLADRAFVRAAPFVLPPPRSA